MANPGPAVTVTPNTQAVTAPIQTPLVGTNSGPAQGTNARRLLAAARSLNLAATGDQAVIPVINSLYYIVEEVIVCNGQVNGVAAAITTAGVGIYTSAAKGGTTIVASVALTTNSAANSVWSGATISTSASATAISVTATNPNIYFNVNTSLAAATCDVFVYGVDLT